MLILGAGASVDYDYLTGPELRDEIVTGLEGGPVGSLYKRISDHRPGSTIDYHKEFVEQFREQLAGSPLPTIDQFIEEHPEYDKIGRESIVAALLPFEKPETLIRVPKTRWYDYLWDVLTRDFSDYRPLTEPRRTRERVRNFTRHFLKILTFNYDRSLEEYLGRGLREAFGFDDESIKVCLSHLGMIHLYGSLGLRPYIDKDARPYHYTDDRAVVQESATQIKILGDSRTAGDPFAKVPEMIDDATKVILLGFGYDRINLQRLNLASLARGNRTNIYGTTYKMTRREVHDAKTLLHHTEFVPHDTDCMGLFDSRAVALD